MLNEKQRSMSVDIKDFRDWESASGFTVNKIFDFSDDLSNSSLAELVEVVVNQLKDNDYFSEHTFVVSDEISILKTIIDFYIQSSVWMHDPSSMRGTSPSRTIEQAVDLHQAMFLLASRCSISLFEKLSGDDISLRESSIMHPSPITETVIKKQHDYGPNNVSKFGIWGLVVRIHDKIARIDNLLSDKRQGSNAIENESVVDTLIDIVGYSTVMIMWLYGWFLLPMRQDV